MKAKLSRRKLAKGALDRLKKLTQKKNNSYHPLQGIQRTSSCAGAVYQVRDNGAVVNGNFRTHTCDCQMYQERGLPCKHAIVGQGKTNGQWKVFSERVDQTIFNDTWVSKNITKLHEKALDGRKPPLLEVVLDMIHNNGRITDIGLKMVAQQLGIPDDDDEFQKFKDDWRVKSTEAAKAARISDTIIMSDKPMIKNPSHDGCREGSSCKFCDAKIRGKNRMSNLGRKREARIASDMDKS